MKKAAWVFLLVYTLCAVTIKGANLPVSLHVTSLGFGDASGSLILKNKHRERCSFTTSCPVNKTCWSVPEAIHFQAQGSFINRVMNLNLKIKFRLSNQMNLVLSYR